MEFFDILKEASEDVGLVINEKKYKDFIKYKNLIKEWNEKINITAIKEDEEIVKKHFIDSFKVYKFEPLKDCKKIIDVGTGGGFPGIPMKIINEDIKITLLDSLKKRINFLNNVVDELQLKDVETIHGRAEEFGSNEEYREQYDAVVSRAVANMSVLSEYCLPFLKVGGYFVALKGPSIEEEMEKGKKAISILGGKLEKIIPVDIEGSDLQHNLVVVKKVKKIEKKYPRNSKKISKNPLG